MRNLFLAAVIAVLAGCASGPPIDTRYTSRNQDSRAQFLILHYTVGNFQGALRELTVGSVSSHYLVNDSPPTIYRLVDENRRAYHAGASSWQGQTQLNAASIGIEIVNPGGTTAPAGKVWADFPQPQIDAVIALAKKIVAEHAIKPERILGHSDIAPQRRQDPGPRFPWKQLADAGLIPWPDANRVAQKKNEFEAALPDIDWFQQKLARHGFAVPLNSELDEATVTVLSAFQMKYRPALFDGMPDAETAALLEVLTTPATDNAEATTAAPPEAR